MEDGSERPIGFRSRTRSAAESNYSHMDKEGAAVIFGLKKFYKYIFGRSFEIVTDHKPLLSLFHEEKQIPVTASPQNTAMLSTDESLPVSDEVSVR